MAATGKSANGNATEQVGVRPLSIHIGAEISRVDLTQPLAPAEVASIQQALLDWKVIFFRDQQLDHRQHIEFARQFGEPTPAHVIFGTDAEYPEIYPVTRKRTAFAGRPAAARVWSDWHTDITAAVNPPFASILRAVVVPPYGGDTHWTNMAAAFSALSPALQDFLCSLRCMHRFKSAQGDDDADAYNAKVAKNPLMAEHPLVVVHPQTGERSLYTSSEFSRNIVASKRAKATSCSSFCGSTVCVPNSACASSGSPAASPSGTIAQPSTRQFATSTTAISNANFIA